MSLRNIFGAKVKLIAVCSISILTQVVFLLSISEYNNKSEAVNSRASNLPSIKSPNDTMLHFYRNDQFAHPDKQIK